MNVYVVTDVEAGWDCVIGVYKAKSKEKVKEHLDKEFGRDTEDFLVIYEENIYTIK